MNQPDDEVKIEPERLDRYQWDEGDVTIERAVQPRTDDAREKLEKFLIAKGATRLDGVSTHELASRVLMLTGGTRDDWGEAAEITIAAGRADFDPDQPRDESGKFGEGGGSKSGRDIVKELHGKSAKELHGREMTKEQRVAEFNAVKAHAGEFHQKMSDNHFDGPFAGLDSQSEREHMGRTADVQHTLSSHPDTFETQSKGWVEHAAKGEIKGLSNPITGLKMRKGETAEQHWQRHQETKASLPVAHDAILEGKHDVAHQILKNAGMSKAQRDRHVAEIVAGKSGKFGEGGGKTEKTPSQSARIASKSANKTSDRTQTDNDAHVHERAAELHQKAASLHETAGSHEVAQLHKEAANAHLNLASNSPEGTPDEASHNRVSRQNAKDRKIVRERVTKIREHNKAARAAEGAGSE